MKNEPKITFRDLNVGDTFTLAHFNWSCTWRKVENQKARLLKRIVPETGEILHLKGAIEVDDIEAWEKVFNVNRF